MDWKVRASRTGDGKRCKSLWEPWLGSRYNEVMDSIDGRGEQRELTNRLWVVEDEHREVAGMVLTTPPVAVLFVHHGLNISRWQRDPMYRGAVKLAAVAVRPDLRGQGMGAALVERAVEGNKNTANWMYGQVDTSRHLNGFYTRLGFTVHRPSTRIAGPYGIKLERIPGEQWFERTLK